MIVREKKRQVKKTLCQCNKRNPTNSEARKFKKPQRELINAYQKVQIEYIQSQINKMRNSVDDRHPWIAWQAVNEVNEKKITSRAKLKAAGQEEWIQMWQEHFRNLFENSTKVTDKPTMKFINNQQDIKLRQFTQDELDVELRKIKDRKATGFDEIIPEVWKTRKFDDLLL